MNNTYVKIGGRKYRIVLEDISETIGTGPNEDVYGYIDYGQSKIAVEKDMSIDAIQEYLVHELLHALLDRTNLELIARNSTIKEVVENMVEYLTPRFHAFLKDNPKFQSSFLSLDKS